MAAAMWSSQQPLAVPTLPTGTLALDGLFRGRASAARRAAPLLPSASRRGPVWVWSRRLILITPGSVRADGARVAAHG